MARKARDVDVNGLYHVSQSGGDSRLLFETGEDRIKFLEILSQARLKYGFKLYAYCVQQPNKYHLILFTNGSDLSKVMKSLNIAYAMYAKCDGKLFKDRYKSEKIEDSEALKALIEKLHSVDKSDEFNSFCYYENSVDAEMLIDIEPLSILLNHNVSIEAVDSVCMRRENCKNCMETVEEASEKLGELARERKMTVQELIKDKPLRNEMIYLFRKNSLLSLKELGEVFGGLSESSVCKILSQACELHG